MGQEFGGVAVASVAPYLCSVTSISRAFCPVPEIRAFGILNIATPVP
jgi:hypothetical protein